MKTGLKVMFAASILSMDVTMAGPASALKGARPGVQPTAQLLSIFPGFVRKGISEVKPFADAYGKKGLLASVQGGKLEFRIEENGNLVFNRFISSQRFRIEPSFGRVENGIERSILPVDEYIRYLRFHARNLSNKDGQPSPKINYRELPNSVEMVRVAPESNGFLELRVEKGHLKLGILQVKLSTEPANPTLRELENLARPPELVYQDIDSIVLPPRAGFQPVVAQVSPREGNDFALTVVEDTGRGHTVSETTYYVSVRYETGQAKLSSPVWQNSREILRSEARANLPVKRQDGLDVSKGLFDE